MSSIFACAGHGFPCRTPSGTVTELSRAQVVDVAPRGGKWITLDFRTAGGSGGKRRSFVTGWGVHRGRLRSTLNSQTANVNVHLPLTTPSASQLGSPSAQSTRGFPRYLPMGVIPLNST